MNNAQVRNDQQKKITSESHTHSYSEIHCKLEN